MNEKRFKLAYEKGNEAIFEDLANPYPRRMTNKEVERKLNEQQATIEELRLQEKEKGVPVFVVREGKNPIALFFNEQRASLYCQENMANLTYQQEKWCRVE